MCFLALIPLFYAIEKYMKQRSFFKNLCSLFFFGFSLYSTLMLWLLELRPVLEEQLSAALSVALILLAVFLSAFFLGVFHAAGMVWICRIAKGKYSDAILFGFVYILGEFLTQHFTPLSFPWARLCAIATPFSQFIQSANLFGGLFVSLIIAIINAFLCLAILNFKDLKKCIVSVTLAILLFFANTAYGTIRLAQKDDFEYCGNAIVVQGNFSGLSKWRSSREEIITTYISLATELIDENTKYVILPETAAPFRLYQDEESLKMLTDFASRNDIVLVTGVFYEENNQNVFNSLICIEPDGTISEPYHKQILVPIGEYVPFADALMEHYPDLFDIIGYVKPGDGNGAIETSNGRIGGVICYESIYSDIVRKTVGDGAQIITLISNDSWFGESAALYQHHSHAILRAVENNRFVFRASSTAITSVTDPYGNVIESAPKLSQAALKAQYSNISEKTLYCQIGDVILIPNIFIVAFSLYICGCERKKHNINSSESGGGNQSSVQ